MRLAVQTPGPRSAACERACVRWAPGSQCCGAAGWGLGAAAGHVLLLTRGSQFLSHAQVQAPQARPAALAQALGGACAPAALLQRSCSAPSFLPGTRCCAGSRRTRPKRPLCAPPRVRSALAFPEHRASPQEGTARLLEHLATSAGGTRVPELCAQLSGGAERRPRPCSSASGCLVEVLPAPLLPDLRRGGVPPVPSCSASVQQACPAFPGLWRHGPCLPRALGKQCSQAEPGRGLGDGEGELPPRPERRSGVGAGAARAAAWRLV